jgi:GAF domain-containing protein
VGGPGRSGAVARAVRVEALCRRGVQAAAVDGAGVSMSVSSGAPHPVASTDELSALVEELQFTTGEGPCFDAVATRSPVLIGDLASKEEAVASRWPAFLDEALAAGIRAVFAFPVGHGATPVGTLDLYRCAPGPLVSDRLRGALLTADVVGLALVADEDTLDEDDDDRGWFHMEVHRAAGMVMVQTGGTIEEALLVMRASAYGEGISVNDLAAEVVSGRRRYTKEQM